MAIDTKTAFKHVTIDQRAWEFAKMQLGPDATITDVIARAERYKDAMLRNDVSALEGLTI
jgi:hypothetical protein